MHSQDGIRLSVRCKQCHNLSVFACSCNVLTANPHLAQCFHIASGGQKQAVPARRDCPWLRNRRSPTSTTCLQLGASGLVQRSRPAVRVLMNPPRQLDDNDVSTPHDDVSTVMMNQPRQLRGLMPMVHRPAARATSQGFPLGSRCRSTNRLPLSPREMRISSST